MIGRYGQRAVAAFFVPAGPVPVERVIGRYAGLLQCEALNLIAPATRCGSPGTSRCGTSCSRRAPGGWSRHAPFDRLGRQGLAVGGHPMETAWRAPASATGAPGPVPSRRHPPAFDLHIGGPPRRCGIQGVSPHVPGPARWASGRRSAGQTAAARGKRWRRAAAAAGRRRCPASRWCAQTHSGYSVSQPRTIRTTIGSRAAKPGRPLPRPRQADETLAVGLGPGGPPIDEDPHARGTGPGTRKSSGNDATRSARPALESPRQTDRPSRRSVHRHALAGQGRYRARAVERRRQPPSAVAIQRCCR